MIENQIDYISMTIRTLLTFEIKTNLNKYIDTYPL